MVGDQGFLFVVGYGELRKQGLIDYFKHFTVN